MLGNKNFKFSIGRPEMVLKDGFDGCGEITQIIEET